MIRTLILSDEKIASRIHLIRGKKVMLDADLAELYNVETGHLKRQVKRNIDRFPDDFMFVLTKEENLRCQIGISSYGGSRYLPMAFTEQGVAMLSSVLASKKAIAVNIQIIRVFTRMREILTKNKDVLLKLEKLEKKIMQQDAHLRKHEDEILAIFAAVKKILVTIEKEEIPEVRPEIGFRIKRRAK